jgi:cytochrome c556
MKSSARHLVLAVATAFAGAGISWPAVGQDKDKVIAERQSLMKDQARDAIAVKNYLEGKGEQAAALAGVESLSKSVPTVPKYFPPGTEGPTPDGKFATKPEVWSEHDKFLAAVKKVGDQVAALDVALRSGDKAKAEAAYKDLGFCSACHDAFRTKLQ